MGLCPDAVSPREPGGRVTVIVDQTCKADCAPFQSEQPLVMASTEGMLSPEATSSNLDVQLDVSQQTLELLLAIASPEPVTSTGDGSTSFTIQGDEGASPGVRDEIGRRPAEPGQPVQVIDPAQLGFEVAATVLHTSAVNVVAVLARAHDTTKGRTMQMATTRRVIGALGLASTLAVATPGGIVQAQPPEESGVVTRDTSDDLPFYPDPADGLVLLPGPASLDEGCRGEGFPEGARSTIERPNGSVKVSVRHRDVGLNLYESANPFGFLPEQCALALDGDPATVPAEPIGVGIGSVVQHITFHPDGSSDWQNWVVGRLDHPEGSTSPIRAVARYHVTATGELDLQQLDIVVGG